MDGKLYFNHPCLTKFTHEYLHCFSSGAVIQQITAVSDVRPRSAPVVNQFLTIFLLMDNVDLLMARHAKGPALAVGLLTFFLVYVDADV